MPKKIVLCAEDILFFSKIALAAQSFHIEIVQINGIPEEIIKQVIAISPSGVFIDINAKKTDVISLIRSMKTHPATASIPLLGFVSHVDTEIRDAAISAGCDNVLARSAFIQRLPDLLSAL